MLQIRGTELEMNEFENLGEVVVYGLDSLMWTPNQKWSPSQP